MTQASVEKNTAIKRISEMIDHVMDSKSIYQDLAIMEIGQFFLFLIKRI